jgi:hypothetical protein
VYRTYHADRDYEKFTNKPEFIADRLFELVERSTARFEDIPQENPLPDVLTAFEWRQTLANIEHRRDKQAAYRVEEYANSRRSFGAKAMRRELAYVLKHHQYADIQRLEQDVQTLRTAAENYTALADALEAGMEQKRYD